MVKLVRAFSEECSAFRESENELLGVWEVGPCAKQTLGVVEKPGAAECRGDVNGGRFWNGDNSRGDKSLGLNVKQAHGVWFHPAHNRLVVNNPKIQNGRVGLDENWWLAWRENCYCVCVDEVDKCFTVEGGEFVDNQWFVRLLFERLKVQLYQGGVVIGEKLVADTLGVLLEIKRVDDAIGCGHVEETGHFAERRDGVVMIAYHHLIFVFV